MTSTCLSTEMLIIPNYVLFDTIQLVFETSFVPLILTEIVACIHLKYWHIV